MAIADEDFQEDLADDQDDQSESDGEAVDRQAEEFAMAEVADVTGDANDDMQLADTTDGDQQAESDGEATADSALALATALAEFTYQDAVAESAAATAATTADEADTSANQFTSKYAAASASWIGDLSSAFISMNTREANEQLTDAIQDDSYDKLYENSLAADEDAYQIATAGNDAQDAADDAVADTVLSSRWFRPWCVQRVHHLRQRSVRFGSDRRRSRRSQRLCRGGRRLRRGRLNGDTTDGRSATTSLSFQAALDFALDDALANES